MGLITAIRLCRRQINEDILRDSDKTSLDYYVSFCHLNFDLFRQQYEEMLMKDNINEIQLGTAKGKMYAWRDAWKAARDIKTDGNKN